MPASALKSPTVERRPTAARPRTDLAVVGGGIVGLATAMEWLAARPGSAVVVLEKEPHVGAHQTGHNSGAIHSGLYYTPGSLKAQTCVAGATLLMEFCRARRIPYAQCGKLVVATDESELPLLQTLHERGQANGVEGVALIGPERLRELEPHARGIRALHVPSAGLVDYSQVARAFADVIRQRGGAVRVSTRVERMARDGHRWRIETTAGLVQASCLITCGGLHADRLAGLAGADRNVRIIPFRGEYYDVVPQRRHLVKAMIYPVPDPRLPFLGVHFTRTITGGLHAGPNAVLALKREGYRKRDVDLADTLELLAFPGFWKMVAKYWAVGAHESYRSWVKAAFVQSLQRLVPEIRGTDLIPNGSGVRAQAVDVHGSLVDDFSIVQGDGAIHVRNVPSPAATASIRIGQLIVERALGLAAGVSPVTVAAS